MTILQTLDDHQLISASANELRKIIDNYFRDLFQIAAKPPSKFVTDLYQRYLTLPETCRSNSMNGSFFELLVAVVLFRNGVHPLYQEVELSFVPHARFDIVAFQKDKPIHCMSLKTSFRERWKQADLEALALKGVHRTAKCWLISYDTDDAVSTQKKIHDGGALAIDEAISVQSNRFDQLVSDLAMLELTEPPTNPLMKKARLTSKN